jgi:hypothetical protein
MQRKRFQSSFIFCVAKYRNAPVGAPWNLCHQLLERPSCAASQRQQEGRILDQSCGTILEVFPANTALTDQKMCERSENEQNIPGGVGGQKLAHGENINALFSFNHVHRACHLDDPRFLHHLDLEPWQ